MAIVTQIEHEGYSISFHPVEAWDVVITDPQGEEIFNSVLEDMSESAAELYAKSVVDEHIEENEGDTE